MKFSLKKMFKLSFDWESLLTSTLDTILGNFNGLINLKKKMKRYSNNIIVFIKAALRYFI